MKTALQILGENLVGKFIKHRNSHGREVVLKAEGLKIEHRHKQITPDTPENDWWGKSKDWDEMYLEFVDGSRILISLETKLEIIEQ